MTATFLSKCNISIKWWRQRERLRRRAENPLEFVAKVRLIGKFELCHHGLVRVSLRDQSNSSSTFQFPGPSSWRFIVLLCEEPLQGPYGNTANGGHCCGLKSGFLCELLPIHDFEESSTHRQIQILLSIPQSP